MKQLTWMVTAAVLLFSQAGLAGEPLPRPGWYVGVSGGMIAPEGGREGYTRNLVAGYRSAYESAATPRSYVSTELEISDSVRQVRTDGRREKSADVLTVGAYLIGNSHVAEHTFLRSRLGAVFREIDRRDNRRSRQGRLAFGLGIGRVLTPRTEAVVDLGAQYWGTGAQLYYTATAGLRFHF